MIPTETTSFETNRFRILNFEFFMVSEVLSVFISFISALGVSSQIRKEIRIVSDKVSYIGKTVNGKQSSDFAQYKILFKILVNTAQLMV